MDPSLYRKGKLEINTVGNVPYTSQSNQPVGMSGGSYEKDTTDKKQVIEREFV